MSESVHHFRSTIHRRAIGFEIVGFRPPDSPTSSWFGRVAFALPGEDWPRTNGKPMHALCQINLTELPFRPPRLDDLELITVFIGPDELPTDDVNSNGNNWCLRAYSSIAQLVPLANGQKGSPIRPFPMRPTIIEEDYPCWEDIPCDVPANVEDQYFEMFPNSPGFKLGGWPTLIQSEISWVPAQSHPISPEYVFQIDSTEKGNWMWGDSGVGYFGRGTATGRQNEWAMEWQCH